MAKEEQKTIYKMAVVHDGIVTNVIDAPKDFNPGGDGILIPLAEFFGNGELDDLLQVDGEVPGPGWYYKDNVFSKPAVFNSVEDLLALLAATRYQKEVSGFVTEGRLVQTDRHTQSVLSSLYSVAKDFPDEMISFKTTAGFVRAKASDLVTEIEAVRDHVQRSFQAEHVVAEKIIAEELTTFTQVDAAFLDAFDLRTKPT